MFTRFSPGFLKQLVITILCCTTFVKVGIFRTYTAVLLPQLESGESVIDRVTAKETSFMVAINFAMSPVGSILGGVLSETIGRKKTLIFIFVPLLVAWTIIYFASAVEMFYIAMVFSGVATGMCGTASSYLAEICTAHHRGPLMTFMGLFGQFGGLFGNMIVYWLGWRSSALCFLAISVVGLVSFTFTLPESPTWLVNKGRTNEAIAILQWLRDTESEVKEEIADMKDQVEKEKENRNLSDTFVLIISSWKPFCMFITVHCMVHGAGCSFFSTQIPLILQKMNNPFDGSLAAIVYSLMSFFGSLLCPFICMKFNRRLVHGSSAFGMAIAIGVVAAYQTTIEHWDSRPYWWIVPAGIHAFGFSMTLGVTIVPYIMLGEIFRIEIRGIISNIANGLAFLFSAFFVMTYTAIVYKYGAVTLLWIVVIFSILNVAAAKYILPETKDKTLSQIQDEYYSRKQKPHQCE